jgi:hypothetical protein
MPETMGDRGTIIVEPTEEENMTKRKKTQNNDIVDDGAYARMT